MMRGLLAPLLAAVGFTAVVAVLCVELVSFAHATVGWAQRDLDSRATLVAHTLEEPLRTQNLPALHACADRCRAEGYALTVRTPSGGVFYDSDPHGEVRSYTAEAPCGAYRVRLALPTRRVWQPLVRAVPVFALALLVGVAGMGVFFFVFYRQRVRIRDLTRLEDFRRRFIADFSHELKTPLTGILGAVDLLDGNEKLVGLIRHSAQRLNGLARDVLDLARLERPDAPVRRTYVDLADLVRTTVAAFAPQATAAKVRLDVRLPDDALPPFVCDGERIGQALANLISNALLHSGSSDIVVSLAVEGHRARFAVEDHGVGIPETARAHVFERFYRVDASRNAATGGTGLGLAIVREIVRQHGGDVRFESVHPHGSRFLFTITSELR